MAPPAAYLLWPQGCPPLTPASEAYGLEVSRGHTLPSLPAYLWFFPSPKLQIHQQVLTALPEHTWALLFPSLMLNPRLKPFLSHLPLFKPLVHIHTDVLSICHPPKVRWHPASGYPGSGYQASWLSSADNKVWAPQAPYPSTVP